MKIQSAAQTQRKISGLAAIVIAMSALTACDGGSPASTDTAPAAATADSASDIGTDPAATDKTFHDSAVANGIITARKACDLLMRADAEAAVGQPLPKNTANITLGTCDHTTDDFSAGASLTGNSWESLKHAATSGNHHPGAINRSGAQPAE